MDSRNLTEETRVLHFPGTDQAAWQARSVAVISEIENMLKANTSFIQIYNYAREQRKKIAFDLHQAPVEQFGEIRIVRNHPGDFNDSNQLDYYTRGRLAQAPADPNIYVQMLKIVGSQFDNLIWSDINVPYKTGGLTFTPSARIRYKKAFSSLNEHSTSLRFLMETDLQKNTNTIPFIIIQYCSMDPERYTKGLSLNDLDVTHYMQAHVQGDNALFRLGLLAHELSSEVYLHRGSAAVNGWIIRALARIKGIEIGQLKINSIPFDIYAHVQRNKVQYAINFAKSIKPDFQMQIQYRDECLQEIKLARAVALVYDELDKHIHAPVSPQSFFSAPHTGLLQDLLNDLKRVACEPIPYYKALVLFQEKLLPFVGVNPYGGDQLASRLYPVFMSINKELQAERANYYRDPQP